jgi:hypothetical protein
MSGIEIKPDGAIGGAFAPKVKFLQDACIDYITKLEKLEMI